MPKYKVSATTEVKSMGIFDAATPEEAMELFRSEDIKIDYTASSLGYLTSGWNPVAEEIINANI
jgi:hypothetical protein